MKSLERQVGGEHYKLNGIEPAEFIIRNGLNFTEGNAIKYIARHRTKKGAEDLLKAKHYIDMLLEYEYNVDPDGNPYEEDEPDNYERAGVGLPFDIVIDEDLSFWDQWCEMVIPQDEYDNHRED